MPILARRIVENESIFSENIFSNFVRRVASAENVAKRQETHHFAKVLASETIVNKSGRVFEH